MNDGNGYPAPGTTPRMRLRLNTLMASRKSLARVLRLRAQGKMDSALFRDLVYGPSSLLSYWRSEELEGFEQRLAELERSAREAQEGRAA